MNNKIKSIISVSIFAVLLFSASAFCVFSPEKPYSESERRPLAQYPEISLSTLLSGEFMEGFEEYATDRFPSRDFFRKVKALFNMKVLGKLDNNGLFMADGHISKLDGNLNIAMLDHAGERFKYLYDTYIKDSNCNVYFSVVPDKNFYLAEENGYPSLDYNMLIDEMKKRTDYMKYIDITGLLSADDYYKTDTHWKQENIVDIAMFLGKEMGTKIEYKYEAVELDNPFYGVYSGQLPIGTAPDKIKYITTTDINEAVVTYYNTGKPKEGELYDMNKAYGKDPYEMFLSGSAPLVTIENPRALNDKELIMFRDSFGGSLAPLMIPGYKKITAIDIRYINSSLVGNFVDFEGSDVLFLYSTTLLNNSLAMK